VARTGIEGRRWPENQRVEGVGVRMRPGRRVGGERREEEEEEEKGGSGGPVAW